MKPIEVKRRHPAAIVLEALLDGQRFMNEGECYCLSDEFSFGVVRRVRTVDEKGDEIEEDSVFGSLSVQAFINLCFSLPEETVTDLAFQRALTKVKEQRLSGI